MSEEVGSVGILDNFREKSRSENPRGRLPMGNSCGLVVGIRSAMGDCFISKPTFCRLGYKGFLSLWELKDAR